MDIDFGPARDVFVRYEGDGSITNVMNFLKVDPEQGTLENDA